ncbi:MAG: ComF family protein [Psychromonas sp.]
MTSENLILNFITQQCERFIEALLPAQCLVCALSSNNKLICLDCEKSILSNRNYCLHCALPLHKNADYCGDCLTKNYLFNHIHALGDYTKPLSTLIKQLKYQQQLITGELLAYLLLKSILLRYTKEQLLQFDLLLAVPLHPQKLRQRGFNQAQIICERLHKKLHIPLLEKQIVRIKKTIPQEGLSVTKRQDNLKGAFIYNETSAQILTGKNVIIIDDVVTTGATLNSLCRVLKEKGVNDIIIFCICRTSLYK